MLIENGKITNREIAYVTPIVGVQEPDMFDGTFQIISDAWMVIS